MENIVPRFTKILTQKEIEQLFPFVNTGRDCYVDVKSHALVDKIIELWFETQGYDFWNNPFPDVIEWTVNKNKEIEFVYLINNQ